MFILAVVLASLLAVAINVKAYESNINERQKRNHLSSSHLGIICTTACISAMIYNLLLECLNSMSRKTQRARKVKSILSFISIKQRSLSTYTNVQKVKWIYSPTYSVCVAFSEHNMPTVETALNNEISWQHMCNRIVSVAVHSKSLAGQIYCCKMPISSQYCNLVPISFNSF